MKVFIKCLKILLPCCHGRLATQAVHRSFAMEARANYYVAIQSRKVRLKLFVTIVMNDSMPPVKGSSRLPLRPWNHMSHSHSCAANAI